MIDLREIITKSYNKYSNQDLILAGGASGHMSHLFEDPDLKFKDLKDIFTKLFK